MTKEDDMTPEDAILNEATHIFKQAEYREYTGEDYKPWEARDDEPITMSTFRRFESGSDERELMLMSTMLDAMSMLDHTLGHVCPAYLNEEDEDENHPEFE